MLCVTRIFAKSLLGGKKRLPELKALSGAAGRIESQPAIRGWMTCIHILAGLTY